MLQCARPPTQSADGFLFFPHCVDSNLKAVFSGPDVAEADRYAGCPRQLPNQPAARIRFAGWKHLPNYQSVLLPKLAFSKFNLWLVLLQLAVIFVVFPAATG